MIDEAPRTLQPSPPAGVSTDGKDLMDSARNRAADFEKAIDKIAEESEKLDAIIVQHTQALVQLTDNAKEEATLQLRVITNRYSKSALSEEHIIMAQKAYITRSISHRGKPGKKSAIPRIIASLHSVLNIPIPSTTTPPPTIQTALSSNCLALTKEPSTTRFIFERVTREITSITTQKRRGTYRPPRSNRTNDPVAIAVHPLSGRLYIADCANHCIAILTPELKLHKTCGSKGTLPGQFSSPVDVSISRDGQRVAVADMRNKRVQIFDSDMNVLSIVDENIPGLDGNLLFTAVCFDDDGNLFAVTPYTGVVKLSATNQVLNSFGGPYSARSVHQPYGLAIDYETKEVIVQSMGLDVVHVFGMDGVHRRMTTFNTEYTGGYPLSCGDGRFAVSQMSGGCVSFCDQEGHQFHRVPVGEPRGSAFGPNGQFYVVSGFMPDVFEF